MRFIIIELPRNRLYSILDHIKAYFRALIETRKINRQVGLEHSRRVNSWVGQRFPTPAPNFVKWQVLKKWGGNRTWIETGTYTGETTLYLSNIAETVISIEPAKVFALAAKEKFKKVRNVYIVEGTSEENLAATLEGLNPEQLLDVSFWLDGHYSGGNTFLAEKECPILDELAVIETYLNTFEKITILIDDVRVFSPSGSNIGGYPSLSFLVQWADAKNLRWGIEYDIFIMTNRIL